MMYLMSLIVACFMLVNANTTYAGQTLVRVGSIQSETFYMNKYMEKFQEIVGWIEHVACGRDLFDIVTKQAEKNRLMDLAQGLLAQGNLMGRLGASLSTQP